MKMNYTGACVHARGVCNGVKSQALGWKESALVTRRSTTFAILIGFTGLYIAAGKLGLSMAFLNASASPVWPATGLALAGLLLIGYRAWPAVLVGAFVVNLTTAGTINTSLAIAAGNTLEAVAGVMLVRRFARGLAAFDHAPDIFRFVVFAAIPSTMISATVGVSSLAMAHFVPWELYAPVWLTWWTGDLVGDLIIAPLVIIWAVSPWPRLNRASLAEAVALAVFLVVLDDLIFFRWHLQYGRADALAYLAIPPLIWAAFSFRQRGAVTAASVLSAIAVCGTLRGTGPFSSANANESLLLLQAFIGVNTLMALILAAVVAERKRAYDERDQILQRERSARAEAEQANRAKDQFLAVLSHELRTPLTPVLLATTLLEKSPDLPQDLAEHVQMIRRNVELEARLIDDLLDLTRITRGKLQLNPANVDVHELLRRAMGIACPDRSADLVVQLEATRHHVQGDPARLQQVFWNLLSNAVKFTPSGKSITVRTSNAEDQSVIEAEISDSGAGIEPQFLPRLFNAFEQGDTARARRFGGLGLGLAIAKALVEAHGGTIAARSAGLDAGATFTVRLPAVAAPQPDGSDPFPRRPPAGRTVARAKVLLVEDHEETLRLLARLLTNLGHDVVTASSIKTAQEAARAQQFDLLISDLGLPDGMGYELMRSLRTANHLRGIALSGYGMSEDIQLSREAGFAEHLVKPVDIRALEEAIARVLAK
jgi:signal transduction histidine kinase